MKRRNLKIRNKTLRTLLSSDLVKITGGGEGSSCPCDGESSAIGL